MTDQTRSFGLAVGGVRDPADRASIRRANLGMILRQLGGEGPRSRTLLAKETGLPKATISSLVAELAELGLVREGDFERDTGSIGRPRQSVELDGRGVCGIGVEINVDYVAVIALDLRGSAVFERRLAADALRLGPAGTLAGVVSLTGEALKYVRAQGIEPVGVTVAVPGGTDAASGSITMSANLGWHDVAVASALREGLGSEVPPIGIRNDAQLGTIAEYVAVAGTGVRDMLYITGDIGVGGGIVADGQEFLGFRGAACEIGHMPFSPEPTRCGCGRTGCWETVVSLNALLVHAADPDDPVRDPWTDREQRLAEIRRRAEDGDARTLAALAEIAGSLGRGTALLVDVLDPKLVVFGGYFAYLGDYLLEEVQRTLDSRILDSAVGAATVARSVHGFTSAVRGAAQLALEAVFQDPGSVVAGPGPSR